MKKQLLLSLLAVTLSTGAVFAQEGAAAAQQGRMQPKAPNERTKETLLKLQNDIGLTNEQGGKAYDPFFNFFTAQQKAMEDMRASGNMDREAMKAKREELAAIRDKELAKIFTPDQMIKFKEWEQAQMKQRMAGQGRP